MKEFFLQMSFIELILSVFIPSLIGSLFCSWLIVRRQRSKEE